MHVHSKHQHWLLFATYAICHYLPIPDHACVERFVCLHNLVSFSSRLRGLVIRSIELVGYEGFEGVGIERLVELLNRLHVAVEDMVWFHSWYGCPPSLRGNSTPIPLVLGGTGGACNFAAAAVGRSHLLPTDHDISHRSPGMEQVGVLDWDCRDFMATGGQWDNRRGS